MVSMLPLVIAFASASAATVPADNVGAALHACSQLPIERQRACVEPHLEGLPPGIARMVVFETDPALHAASESWQVEMDAALRSHATALAQRGSARDLLAAALLWPLAPPVGGVPGVAPEARQWFAAARAALPPEPLVDWLEATDCGGLADDCDREGAIARLLAADPGNAAAHLLALHGAERRRDLAAIARHLRSAARAERYAPFYAPMLELIMEAHDEVTWPAPDPALGEALSVMWGISAPVELEDFAAVQAAGRAMAIAYPGLSAVTRACPADERGAPELLEDCKALYARVAGGDGPWVDQLIALVHLSQLTAGEPQGDAWREQLRQLYWVLEQGPPLMPGTPGSGITAGEYVRLQVEKGELDAMREVLRREGIPAAPPVGWLPTQARQRALVTTGIPGDRSTP